MMYGRPDVNVKTLFLMTFIILYSATLFMLLIYRIVHVRDQGDTDIGKLMNINLL